jgi:hypothetical protein
MLKMSMMHTLPVADVVDRPKMYSGYLYNLLSILILTYYI